MTENKRFTFDIDNENGYDEEHYFCNGTDSFYVNNADEMELFIKEINKLAEENNQLNKTVECLDKTVKEQCNKLDWADECGVKWEEEYNKWIGGKND